MSGWLRNLQGQLTELASEVLNEATEEVADPESELQVARSKCAVAERSLIQEQQKVSGLDAKVKDLEDQLYQTHVEMDTIGTKYGTMVQARDEQIKRLQVELEQSRTSFHDDVGGSLEEKVVELKKEVAHWKEVVKQHQQSQSSGVSAAEADARVEDMRRKKEAELAAIMAQHAHQIQELRDEYEEKISSLQMASSSESGQSDLLDAVLLEKEELLEEKKRLEELVRQKAENDKPVMLDLVEDSDFAGLEERVVKAEADLLRMSEMSDEIDKKNQEILMLRRQNDELTLAYNDLNCELENTKESHGQQTNNNQDLLSRIDHLKANLIEYEERYELCKRENAETVRQLEKLSNDFERLKNGFDESKQRAFAQDDSLNSEVERLRQALEQSKIDRDRLRDDVDKFRGAVSAIDTELQTLRDSNRKLGEENVSLGETIDRYDASVKNLLSRNENELKEFRTDFEDLQQMHSDKETKWEALNAELQEKCSILETQLAELQSERERQELEKEQQSQESRVELLEEASQSPSNEFFASQPPSPSSSNNGLEKRFKAALQEIEELKAILDEKSPSWDGVPASTLIEQLKEALSANTEKTEEYERLRMEKELVEKELAMRQSVVDEMIAQTNILQMQEQNAAVTIKQLRNEINERERRYYEVEREFARERDRWNEIERSQLSNEDDSQSSPRTASETTPADAKELEAINEKLKSMTKYAESLEHENMSLGVEIDKLRKQIDGVSESESDDREKSTNQTSSVVLENMKAEITAKTKEIQEKDIVIRNLKTDLATSRKETQKVREEKSELMQSHCSEIEKLEAKLISEGQVIGSMEKQLAIVIAEKIRLLEKSKDLEMQLQCSVQGECPSSAELMHQMALLEQANNQLKEIATAKHQESINYYNGLESALRDNKRILEDMLQLDLRAQRAESHINSLSADNEKRVRELNRLKDHLMLVEESSTKEAVEAEKRETELRALVRSLEERSQNASHTVIESSQHYQAELGLLRARLEASEAESMELRDKYELECRDRSETQSALSSLQTVVRELASDQERDAATASHQQLQLQQKLQECTAQISDLRTELERVGLDKQAAEEQTEALKERLDTKQRIVEELEVQLEEARAPSNKQKDAYRIDDATLRQLFLNYFLAPPDKRGDIAMLLTSILEYSEEDKEKIKQSVRPNAAPQRARSQGPSITEQFIRFLETESESSRTAPHLPVTQETSHLRTDPEISASRQGDAASALHNILK